MFAAWVCGTSCVMCIYYFHCYCHFQHVALAASAQVQLISYLRLPLVIRALWLKNIFQNSAAKTTIRCHCHVCLTGLFITRQDIKQTMFYLQNCSTDSKQGAEQFPKSVYAYVAFQPISIQAPQPWLYRISSISEWSLTLLSCSSFSSILGHVCMYRGSSPTSPFVPIMALSPFKSSLDMPLLAITGHLLGGQADFGCAYKFLLSSSVIALSSAGFLSSSLALCLDFAIYCPSFFFF